MFTANQTGLHARHMAWFVLSRGMDRETVLPFGERIDRLPEGAKNVLQIGAAWAVRGARCGSEKWRGWQSRTWRGAPQG
jgi:hypothetical protein